MTRAGVAHLINEQPDLEVCGEAGTPHEALALMVHTKPALILAGLSMPGRSGVEFIKDLLAIHPGQLVLVFSMHDELIYAERVLRAGARGYIMKENGPENILVAIRLVLNGHAYVSEHVSKRMVDALSGTRGHHHHSPISTLTDREFEIFQLIGQGKSTREIAKQFGLSPKTVDVHRTHLREKLELPNSTSLMRHAVRWFESQHPFEISDSAEQRL